MTRPTHQVSRAFDYYRMKVQTVAAVRDAAQAMARIRSELSDILYNVPAVSNREYAVQTTGNPKIPK